MPQKANTPVTCRVCNKEWLVTPQHAQTHKGYCAEHRIQGVQTSRKANYTGPKPNRICIVCQRPFHAMPWQIAAGLGTTCDDRCRGRSQQIPITIPKSDLNLAYMAGIVDGEGTVTAHRTTPNPNTGKTGISCKVIVGNSNVALMEWMHDIFGGRIATPKRARKANHKPVLTWFTSSDQAFALCKALLPYLKVKRRQAEILLELEHLRYEQLPGRVGRYVSDETRAAREPLLAEIAGLNHRGLITTPELDDESYADSDDREV